MKRSPIALGVSGLVFAGWLVYLGVQAWQYRTPPLMVSRSQLLASQYDVVLFVADGGNGKPVGVHVEVIEVIHAADKDGPTVGQKIDVLNLDSCAGFVGEGRYVLPLVKRGKAYQVAVPPLDPGASVNFRPTIYPLSDAVHKQVLDIRAGVGP